MNESVDKRRKLKDELNLTLRSAEGGTANFKVDNYIGSGGTSIVYEVHRGKERGILKEFFPNISGVNRGEDDEKIIIEETMNLL